MVFVTAMLSCSFLSSSARTARPQPPPPHRPGKACSWGSSFMRAYTPAHSCPALAAVNWEGPCTGHPCPAPPPPVWCAPYPLHAAVSCRGHSCPSILAGSKMMGVWWQVEVKARLACQGTPQAVPRPPRCLVGLVEGEALFSHEP